MSGFRCCPNYVLWWGWILVSLLTQLAFHTSLLLFVPPSHHLPPPFGTCTQASFLVLCNGVIWGGMCSWWESLHGCTMVCGLMTSLCWLCFACVLFKYSGLNGALARTQWLHRLSVKTQRAIANLGGLGAAILVSVGWTTMCRTQWLHRLSVKTQRAIANLGGLGAAIFVSVGWTKMCVSAVLA